MPDTSLPAHWAARWLLLISLIGTVALVPLWFWHLLTPEGWHWLNADQLDGLKTAGVCLMAPGAVIYALMRG